MNGHTEGGGLRGVFTCGVLDCFMDRGIRSPFTVGVSAGACRGIVDSIPVEYAMSQGYEKLVVVLTRNKGYRKPDSRMPLAKLASLYQEGYDIASHFWK